MSNRDKDLHNAYMKQWYQDNKDHVRSYRKQKRIERRELLADIKRSRGCRDCGNSDPRVLQFHHNDPGKKSFTVSHYLIKASEERLREEIDKCDILCANCHIIHHYEERE